MFSLKIGFLFFLVLQLTLGKKYHNYEEPQWELIGNQPEDGSYEVRRYSAANWTSTDQSAVNKDLKSSEAFRRLFKYIRGANKGKTVMDMTVPAITRIPGQPCPFCHITFRMSFYVPPKFQSNPPAPTDTRVETEEMSERIFYVRTFSGYAVAKDWQKNAALLYSSLLRNGVSASSVDRSMYYAVGYDKPTRLFLHRNEVWLMSTNDNLV
ncbi:unnamed protein product [Clavelina lepadiformis]|uniref:Heme-binding protein 2 n=1 Tax=Clavelina lepadiformis TaxID=159417 RepID=A0ABP0GS93_CLALP